MTLDTEVRNVRNISEGGLQVDVTFFGVSAKLGPELLLKFRVTDSQRMEGAPLISGMHVVESSIVFSYHC